MSTTTSIAEAQERIVENFSLFDDWEGKYEYLIDLGKALPPLSEQYKNGKGNIIKAVFNGFISNLKAWGNIKKCSSVIYIVSKVN